MKNNKKTRRKLISLGLAGLLAMTSVNLPILAEAETATEVTKTFADDFETAGCADNWTLYGDFKADDGTALQKNVATALASEYLDDTYTVFGKDLPKGNVFQINPSVNEDTYKATGTGEEKMYGRDAVTMVTPNVWDEVTEFEKAEFDLYADIASDQGQYIVFNYVPATSETGASWDMLVLFLNHANSKVQLKGSEYHVDTDITGTRTMTATKKDTVIKTLTMTSGLYSDATTQKMNWMHVEFSYSDEENAVFIFEFPAVSSSISVDNGKYTSSVATNRENRMVALGTTLWSSQSRTDVTKNDDVVIDNFSMTYKASSTVEEEDGIGLYTNTDLELTTVVWGSDYHVVSEAEHADIIIYKPESSDYATTVEGYLKAGKQVILLNNVDDTVDGVTAASILQYAKDKNNASLSYIDTEAYGSDDVNMIAKAIQACVTIDTSGAVTYHFDESQLNSFLTPELRSGTIKNAATTSAQNLGFETNAPQYTRTGTTIKSQGTIFAFYPSNANNVADVLAKMTLANAQDTNVTDVIYTQADNTDTSYIAGVSKNAGISISYKYIARSYIEYEDGTIYYSVNTRDDITDSSYAGSKGVIDGYAVRSVISVAKEMVKHLYALSANDDVSDEFDTATSGIVSGVSEEGAIQWAEGVTSNADTIFNYIATYSDKIKN